MIIYVCAYRCPRRYMMDSRRYEEWLQIHHTHNAAIAHIERAQKDLSLAKDRLLVASSSVEKLRERENWRLDDRLLDQRVKSLTNFSRSPTLIALKSTLRMLANAFQKIKPLTTANSPNASSESYEMKSIRIDSNTSLRLGVSPPLLLEYRKLESKAQHMATFWIEDPILSCRLGILRISYEPSTLMLGKVEAKALQLE
jgi:hypothetical protein